MTAVHLNAELYKAMGEIAEDEVLLKKVLRYVKKPCLLMGITMINRSRDEGVYHFRFE